MRNLESETASLRADLNVLQNDVQVMALALRVLIRERDDLREKLLAPIDSVVDRKSFSRK